MMSKKLVFLFLTIAAATLLSLVTGATYLEAMLPGGLPFGNALSAIGLSSAAVAAFGLSNPGTMHRYMSAAAVVSSIFWLPVSIALAGNLTLNFSGVRGNIWFALNWVLLFLIVLSLGWALVRWLLGRLPA